MRRNRTTTWAAALILVVSTAIAVTGIVVWAGSSGHDDDAHGQHARKARNHPPEHGKVPGRQEHDAEAKAESAPKGAVNTRCPIMGGKVDPARVPDSLTRIFKGHKIGFCCAGCPAAWDKLSEAAKMAKLRGSPSSSCCPT